MGYQMSVGSTYKRGAFILPLVLGIIFLGIGVAAVLSTKSPTE